MMNNIFNYLITTYNKLSATHKYIFVYTFNGMVYMTTTTSESLPYVTKLDKASRGAGYSLRFKPNKQVKTLLMSMNATPICSVKFFNELTADSQYNKGEIAEKLVTEYFGKKWTKDNIPFTEASDINVDGVEYQIKYENATFTNEKSLKNLMAKG